ncbi:MAG: N-acetyltransferase DgcN [Pseudomonadota bacterium]
MYEISPPYLHFLGAAPDRLTTKTSIGVHQWRPEYSVGQYRLEGCQGDLGIEDLSIDAAVERGAKTLIIGVANRGGVFSDEWAEPIVQALNAGLDVVSGLHARLIDQPEFVAAAAANGQRLIDVRFPKGPFQVATGARRTGSRVLTVGTDCSCGKMYTSLAIEREMRSRGMDADFRATGQTGIMIAGDGAPVDAMIADFISGAAEALSPSNQPEHWDLIEGQGSLFHPSFAGVSLGLMHGSQPDWLVMCHEPTRTHMRGLPDYHLPTLQACIDANLDAARLTNENVRLAGLSINTFALGEAEAAALVEELSTQFGLPACDPVRHGVADIVDVLMGA